MEAGDGQAEGGGDDLQQPCAEVASRNGTQEVIGRGKRKLTRSLDMSSNSITSSRRGRLKTSNEASGEPRRGLISLLSSSSLQLLTCNIVVSIHFFFPSLCNISLLTAP